MTIKKQFIKQSVFTKLLDDLKVKQRSFETLIDVWSF